MRVRLQPALRAILAAYLTLFRRLGLLLALGLAVLVSGAVVVYPLWFFSNNWPDTYSRGIGILCTVALAAAVFRHLRREAHLRRAGDRRRMAGEVARKSGAVIAVVASVYGGYVLLAAGRTVLAAAFALTGLGVLGWLLGKDRPR